MGRLMYIELRKIFLHKMTAAILLLLLVFNGIFAWYSANEPLSDVSTNNYTRLDVAAFFHDHEGQTAEKMLAELEQWNENYLSLFQLNEDGTFVMPTQAQLDAMAVYTESVSEEYALYGEIMPYLEGVATYSAYLQRVSEDAQQMSFASAFSDPNSYAYRNIQHTPLVYRAVQEITPTAADSSGILMAVQPVLTTVLLLFAVMLVAMNLTTAEQDSGVLVLIHPTCRGGKCTVLAKLLVFTLVLGALTAAFYGENLAVSQALFGLGDLGRSLQSLEGYLTSPLPWSVGKFLWQFLLSKFLGVLAVGLLFFGLCLRWKHLVPVLLLSAAGLGGEVALYLTIDLHSWLSPLRQINLAALLNTSTLFSDYRAVNFFNWPVNEIVVTGATMFLVVLGSVAWIFRQWCSCESVTTAPRPIRKSPGRHVSVSLTGYELYKLLVTRRGAMILACLLLFQVYSYWGKTIRLDINEQYYQQYAAVLTGALTDEKANYLAEERADFDTLSQQREEIESQVASGQIDEDYGSYLELLLSQKSQQESAFTRAEQQYQYLQSQERLGYSVSFVADTGYNALLRSEDRMVKDAGVLCFALALGLAGFYPMEESSHMTQLIQPSVRGKRSVIRSKLFCALLYTVPVWLVSFLPHMVSIFCQFQLQERAVGARSLMLFSYAPKGVSLLFWLIMVAVARLIAAQLIAVCIVVLSVYSKRTIPTLLIALIMLGIPIVFYAAGSRLELFMLPFLTGKWLLSGLCSP